MVGETSLDSASHDLRIHNIHANSAVRIDENLVDLQARELVREVIAACMTMGCALRCYRVTIGLTRYDGDRRENLTNLGR